MAAGGIAMTTDQLPTRDEVLGYLRDRRICAAQIVKQERSVSIRARRPRGS
jgi:hypothetical protein